MAVLAAPAIIAAACADFSSGQCTDKALCSSDDATIDGQQDAVIDIVIDSVVGPDGNVPDGQCNNGVEDCANGLDDNCDGLIDCADPLCKGAGYVCTDAVPSGWAGLVALATAAGGTIPSCAGAYATLSQSGHTNLNAAAATCGCSCSGPTGEGCFADVDYFGDSNCQSLNQSSALPFNFCVNVGSGNGSVRSKPGVASGGSCSPSPTKTVPPSTWGNSYAACAYNGKTDLGGCTNSGLCIEAPSSGKACVWQFGDVPCPAGAYSSKTTIYTTESDNRGCTSCSCTYVAGSCTAPITVYTGANCSSSTISIQSDNSCHQFSGYSAIAGTITQTAGSCTGGSVTPDGTDSPAGPVTICCAP
jgi:hypothetical protein